MRRASLNAAVVPSDIVRPLKVCASRSRAVSQLFVLRGHLMSPRRVDSYHEIALLPRVAFTSE